MFTYLFIHFIFIYLIIHYLSKFITDIDKHVYVKRLLHKNLNNFKT